MLNPPRLPLLLSLVLASSPAFPQSSGEQDDVYYLPPVTVMDLGPLPGDISVPIRTLDLRELGESPAIRLDEALEAIPGADLFRSASSRSAHPTIQGLSLRQIGGNAAGRTLVLLDGVPQNDPFGGWVNWSAMPAGLVQQATLRTGGGAAPYGPAALTGVLELETMATPESLVHGIYGEGGRRALSLRAEPQFEQASVLLFGQTSRDPGHWVRPEAERGPVDSRAGVDSETGRVSVGTRTANSGLTASAHWFQEERTNDTRMEGNDSRGREVSIRGFTGTATSGLEGLLYWQDREFSNIFTSVNEDRSSESPVVDQFSAPSEAFGGKLSARWEAGPLTGESGADFRIVEGVNNEYARDLGAGFTRRRAAGGESSFVGLYTVATTSYADTDVSAAVRADYWKHSNGFNKEFDLPSNELLLNETFGDRDGWELTGRLGAERNLGERIQVYGAFYNGFRPPTLNELYRSFRVGDVITVANADLDPEMLAGVDLGFRWRHSQTLYGSSTLFAVRLSDAIANVTIGEGPGNFTPGGFVPAGGILRQRQNLDRIETFGWEGDIIWKPASELELTLRWLLTESEVFGGGLDGKRPALTPKASGSVSARWSILENLSLLGQVRLSGASYEDDLNELKLAPYALLDLGAYWQASEQLLVGVKVRNIFNDRIETGRTSDGDLSIGEGRNAWIEATWRF